MATRAGARVVRMDTNGVNESTEIVECVPTAQRKSWVKRRCRKYAYNTAMRLLMSSMRVASTAPRAIASAAATLGWCCSSD